MRPGNLLQELRRRRVLRMAATYIIAGWVVIQVVSEALPALDAGDIADLQPQARGIDPASIAVLQLENLSPDPKQEFFASGMHDALMRPARKPSN